MKKRILQIDVKGPVPEDYILELEDLVECRIIVDGRSCTFWTTKSNYKALMYDKVFIRDGKEKDSAGVINTTNVFEERV